MDKGQSRRGGLARAERMSEQARSDSASLAAAVRWNGGPLPIAICDGVLDLGQIPCFILDDDRRVLSQTGMISALAMKKGGNSRLGGNRLTNFAVGRRISPYISENLQERIRQPIRFKTLAGNIAYGYEGTLLVELCEAILKARHEGALHTQQDHIGRACEALLGGLARVGIIALIDEATGYQDVRAKNALAVILEAFIAKELRPYVKTFQPDYYKQIYRLKGWDFQAPEGQPSARPRALGHITNNLVYARLAPGVLRELKRVTPRDARGRLKHHYHRKLTADLGHPKLLEHLAAITVAMELSPDWTSFVRYIDRRFPAYNKTYQLDLDDPVTPPRHAV